MPQSLRTPSAVQEELEKTWTCNKDRRPIDCELFCKPVMPNCLKQRTINRSSRSGGDSVGGRANQHVGQEELIMGKSRVLIVGLDSAEPELLLRWASEGVLPNLARVWNESAWA